MTSIDKISKWLKSAVNPQANTPSEKQPAQQANSQENRKQGQGRNKNHRPFRKNSPPPAHVSENKAAHAHKSTPVHKGVMRIIPVGGLEEVGKNCMIVEYENDIVVIDMGFQFPEDEMYGVDYVIPDIQYLVERKRRIKGILITHGHLDHIGALPYVLPDLDFPPMYGSKLSLGLAKKQLEEHRMLKQCTFKEVNNKDTYDFGFIKVDFFRVNHSIPDSLGLVIRTPAGTAVHTGDFKFDFTPADGIAADIGKMSEIGRRGVQIMFSDSTNATKPGHTLSERVVGDNLKRSIKNVEGRIIIACFASLIGRIQQILEYAEEHNRKVFTAGGSMVRNVEMAIELGFLKPPKGILQDIQDVNKYADDKVLIITTGSQGEPLAALSRMASDSHRQVKIKKGDTVVLSASPILGNEKSVAFLIDHLARLGAQIVHNHIMDVHTSGHGCQEDLKMMMSLIRPEHLVPIHGNYYMRRAHGDLGPKVGIVDGNVHMMDNGNVIEIRDKKVSFKHEDIGVRFVVIDGLGQGDLGSLVQQERESMSKNGVVTVMLKMSKGRLHGAPAISTHGLVYKKELEKIEREIEQVVKKSVSKFAAKDSRASISDYENYIKSSVAGLLLRQLDRRPLISVKILRA